MTLRAGSAVRNLWKVVFAWGASTLVLGVLVLARPHESLLVVAALLGTYLVTSGIAEIALASVLDATASSRVALFITGALSSTLGVLTFRHFGYSARGSVARPVDRRGLSLRRCLRDRIDR